MKKDIKGVYDPKTRRFFRPSREITANNFQTVRFSHLHVMYHLQEIDAALSESAKILNQQCPRWRYLNQFTDVWDAFDYRLLETWARNGLKRELWQLEMYNRHQPS